MQAHGTQMSHGLVLTNGPSSSSQLRPERPHYQPGRYQTSLCMCCVGELEELTVCAPLLSPRFSCTDGCLVYSHLFAAADSKPSAKPTKPAATKQAKPAAKPQAQGGAGAAGGKDEKSCIIC